MHVSRGAAIGVLVGVAGVALASSAMATGSPPIEVVTESACAGVMSNFEAGEQAAIVSELEGLGFDLSVPQIDGLEPISFRCIDEGGAFGQEPRIAAIVITYDDNEAAAGPEVWWLSRPADDPHGNEYFAEWVRMSIRGETPGASSKVDSAHNSGIVLASSNAARATTRHSLAGQSKDSDSRSAFAQQMSATLAHTNGNSK